MNETIDVRGLSCPEPVMEVRNFLAGKNEGEFSVLLSSAVARDNVRRVAGSMGWKVEDHSGDEEFKLVLYKH